MRILLVMALLGQSCQDERLEGDPSQSIIDGRWQSTCLLGEGRASVEQYSFSFASLGERTETVYEEDCDGRVLHQTRYSGSYELSVTRTSFIHRLRFTVSQGSLEFHHLGVEDGGCEPHGEGDSEVECPLKFTTTFVYDTLLRLTDREMSPSLDFGPSDGLSIDFDEAGPTKTFQRLD